MTAVLVIAFVAVAAILAAAVFAVLQILRGRRPRFAACLRQGLRQMFKVLLVAIVTGLMDHVIFNEKGNAVVLQLTLDEEGCP